MRIYLDIDGVLINHNQATSYANEFLRYILDNYREDTYWLSTRCKGDAAATVQQIAHYFDEDVALLLKNIKPTNWNMAKTEAIDLDQPFLWFDDTLLYGEKEVLAAHNVLDNHILVTLKQKPLQLKTFITDFPLSI